MAIVARPGGLVARGIIRWGRVWNAGAGASAGGPRRWLDFDLAHPHHFGRRDARDVTHDDRSSGELVVYAEDGQLLPPGAFNTDELAIVEKAQRGFVGPHPHLGSAFGIAPLGPHKADHTQRWAVGLSQGGPRDGSPGPIRRPHRPGAPRAR